MNAASLLLLTILNAGLLSGALYGAPIAQTEAQRADVDHRTSTKSATERDRNGGSEKRPVGKVPAIHSNRPESVTRHQAVSAAANSTNIRPGSAAPSAAARSAASMQNEAIYRALPVRPGSAIRPASSSGNARHRDPNAAVIGGPAIPNGRSTAALDGARMNLKTPRN